MEGAELDDDTFGREALGGGINDELDVDAAIAVETVGEAGDNVGGNSPALRTSCLAAVVLVDMMRVLT